MRNNDYKVELNFQYISLGGIKRKSYEDIKKETLSLISYYFGNNKKTKSLKIIRNYKKAEK